MVLAHIYIYRVAPVQHWRELPINAFSLDCSRLKDTDLVLNSEYDLKGAGIACWLERQTHDRKVASSNPGRRGGRIFFSRVNFVC